MAIAEAEIGDFDQRAHLVRERTLREIRAASDWAEGHLGHLFPGFLGAILNPLAKRIYHTIGREEVISRTQEQMDLLIIAARDLQHHDLEDVVARHLFEAFHTEEIYVRGHRDHPAFEDVERVLEELFRDRVRVVGQLLNEGHGATYDELVASVFTRKDVEATLGRQFEGGEGLLRILDEHPEVVGMPHAVRGPILNLVEGAFDWYGERLRGQLDEIFGDDAPEGDASPASAT